MIPSALDSQALCLLFETLVSKSEAERIYAFPQVEQGDEIPPSSDDQGSDAQMVAQMALAQKAAKIRAWMGSHALILQHRVSFLYMTCSSMPMYRLPMECGLFTHLKELILHNQKLRDLPSGLNLPQLTALSLNHNEFDTIRAPINRFSQLKILNLEFNRFTEWDSNVETGCLVGLEVLRLTGNPFRDNSVAKTSELTSLKILEMTRNLVQFTTTCRILSISDGRSRDF